MRTLLTYAFLKGELLSQEKKKNVLPTFILLSKKKNLQKIKSTNTFVLERQSSGILELSQHPFLPPRDQAACPVSQKSPVRQTNVFIFAVLQPGEEGEYPGRPSLSSRQFSSKTRAVWECLFSCGT